jgi:hypothetical protein
MLKTPYRLSSRSIGLPWADWGWAHWFILCQFMMQLLLLFSQFGALRGLMRTASFFISLGLVFWLPGPGIKHPAKGTAIAIMCMLVLQLFLNPGLNTFPAGLAQCAMYLAIIGPVFWASRLKINAAGFYALILLLWAFHTVSSLFGILQVYNPGRYQPFLSTAIKGTIYGGENLKITLANGLEVYRPMGLTGEPGGAAGAGFYALLLGVGIALQARNPLLRIAGAGSSAIGLFCIYLSQVRSVLIFSILCLVILGIVLLRQGKVLQFTLMSSAVGVLFASVFTWAVAVGGSQTMERVMTLFAEAPQEVYQQNRGSYLAYTLQTLLPDHPMGAGLGRWGPIWTYFGLNNNPETRPIWVEIQLTGWLLDGGILLIVAYAVALYLTCHVAWRLANNPQLGDLGFWAGLIFAYDIGAIVITFNYPLFNSQGGMEFWLLNSCLFVAGYKSWLKSDQPPVRKQLKQQS